MGQMSSTTEMPRTDPNMVGPMPGDTTPGTGFLGMLEGLKNLNGFAMKLGDTPEEREKNAKAFASAVKDVGSLTANLSESTLMQQMMKNMGGPSYLDTGTSPSGGVAAIPKTFDPSMASHIVNQMGYK